MALDVNAERWWLQEGDDTATHNWILGEMQMFDDQACTVPLAVRTDASSRLMGTPGHPTHTLTQADPSPVTNSLLTPVDGCRYGVGRRCRVTAGAAAKCCRKRSTPPGGPQSVFPVVISR